MALEFNGTSEKHEKINKENAKIVAAVGVAAFVFIFALFSMRSLLDLGGYHQRVIGEKEDTLRQLEQNNQSFAQLKDSYNSFVNESQNVLTGNPDGDGPLDGDNAQIVLDSLPSEYDYPGLASSLEKLLTEGPYAIESIGGTEDASLSSLTDSSSPVEIPYPISFQASPSDTEGLFRTLELSIRPFYVDTVTIRSSQAGLRTSIGLRTFFQPGVDYELGSKEVR